MGGCRWRRPCPGQAAQEAEARLFRENAHGFPGGVTVGSFSKAAVDDSGQSLMRRGLSSLAAFGDPLKQVNDGCREVVDVLRKGQDQQ